LYEKYQLLTSNKIYSEINDNGSFDEFMGFLNENNGVTIDNCFKELYDNIIKEGFIKNNKSAVKFLLDYNGGNDTQCNVAVIINEENFIEPEKDKGDFTNHCNSINERKRERDINDGEENGNKKEKKDEITSPINRFYVH